MQDEIELIKMDGLVEMLKTSESTIRRKLKSGEIPQGRRLSAKIVVWIKSDIIAWILSLPAIES